MSKGLVVACGWCSVTESLELLSLAFGAGEQGCGATSAWGAGLGPGLEKSGAKGRLPGPCPLGSRGKGLSPSGVARFAEPPGSSWLLSLKLCCGTPRVSDCQALPSPHWLASRWPQ